MGLTKQYLRYIAGPVFNIVASLKSQLVFVDIRGFAGKFCAVGAAEHVIIWDLRKGEKVSVGKRKKKFLNTFSIPCRKIQEHFLSL